MSTEREDLLNEANNLHLEFHSNVKSSKLKEMIAEANGPAIKEDLDDKSVTPPIPKTSKVVKSKDANGLRLRLTPRQRVQVSKARALKLHVVTITNKDNRENDHMTTVSLGFENQHFGISRNVPLDIPVEIEAALIDIAESTMMTLHKDEIIDGKRTGNKVPVSVKKFAVSYGKPPE